MHAHETVLRRLLDRIAARDTEGVAGCCHPDIFLTNPLFPRLRGDAALAFWAMAFAELKDFTLHVAEVSADGDGGHATWTASYTAGTGRTVTMRGRSLFAFREGLVCREYDHFSLWRWSAQAAGPAGAALGWLGPFRWAVRQRVTRRLERFAARAAP
jgi:uncharacterized protein